MKTYVLAVCTALFFVFLILKLTQIGIVAEWSFVEVTAPLWILIVFPVIIRLVRFFGTLFGALLGFIRFKRLPDTAKLQVLDDNIKELEAKNIRMQIFSRLGFGKEQIEKNDRMIEFYRKKKQKLEKKINKQGKTGEYAEIL